MWKIGSVAVATVASLLLVPSIAMAQTEHRQPLGWVRHADARRPAIRSTSRRLSVT